MLVYKKHSTFFKAFYIHIFKGVFYALLQKARDAELRCSQAAERCSQAAERCSQVPRFPDFFQQYFYVTRD